MKRTIFIGDIHGCFDEFIALLEKIQINKSDKIYLTGDVINKGPKSWKMLKFLYKNREQYMLVRGNHEQGFLNWIQHGDSVLKNKKNGEKHQKLYKKIQEKEPKILEYLQNIPHYIEDKDWILVHAGINPDIESMNQQNEQVMREVRLWQGNWWYEQYNGKKKIIYGHFAQDGLQIRKHTIGLDSGCVYGKMLTAYVWETGEIYSQFAFENYNEIGGKIDMEQLKTKLFDYAQLEQ